MYVMSVKFRIKIYINMFIDCDGAQLMVLQEETKLVLKLYTFMVLRQVLNVDNGSTILVPIKN